MVGLLTRPRTLTLVPRVAPIQISFQKVTVLTIEDEKEASEVPGCLTEIDDISAAPYYFDIQVDCLIR